MIGAGVSGLIAAKLMHECSFHVTVLVARKTALENMSSASQDLDIPLVNTFRKYMPYFDVQMTEDQETCIQ